MDHSMILNVGDARSVLPALQPNKKTRTNRAQQVVEAARRRNAEQGNFQDYPTTRIEHGTADGKPTLTAIFPKRRGGEPNRLNLSFLLKFPGLTDFFAEAVLKAMKDYTNMSRKSSVNSLRSSWFVFLRERGYSNLRPENLDEQILTGFNTWLHQARKADGSAYNPLTIRTYLTVLRRVIGASSMEHLVDLVPHPPPGASRKVVPTEVLQFDQLLAVIAAVEKEVLDLRADWEKGQSTLMLGRELLSNGAVLVKGPYRNGVMVVEESNLAIALAMLDQRYPGVIPDKAVVREDDAVLGDTVLYGVSAAKMSRHFYASGRDLVPLALSIAIATVFNPNTILELKWKDINRNVEPMSNGRRAVQFDVTEDAGKVDLSMEKQASEAAESPLAKITGTKPRAGRQLVRLLDPEASGVNQVSLNMVLDLLIDMTTRIRPYVIEPERYRDRIFLYVPKHRAKRAKGFGGDTYDAVGDQVWQTNLTHFIKDNKLPAFSLKTIRATLLDYVQLFNRGDLEAARKVGNHASRITTWTHYTSDLVKRMLKEATGETLLVRGRWLESDGKIDPRKHREWTSKGCATPGWICLDPFDSPRLNQKQGSMCRAYGECPDCPLSAARLDNTHNVMLYEALRRAVYRSIKQVTAPVWQNRWAPVVAALDGLLANVSVEVLKESRKFIVELPDIG